MENQNNPNNKNQNSVPQQNSFEPTQNDNIVPPLSSDSAPLRSDTTPRHSVADPEQSRGEQSREEPAVSDPEGLKTRREGSESQYNNLSPRGTEGLPSETSEQEPEDMLAGTDDDQSIPTEKNTVIPAPSSVIPAKAGIQTKDSLNTKPLETDNSNNNISKPIENAPIVPPASDIQTTPAISKPASPEPVKGSESQYNNLSPRGTEGLPSETPTPPTNQPPAPHEPTSDLPKKNNNWIWWVIGGVAILALAAIYYFFFFQQGGSSDTKSYSTGSSIVYRLSTIPKSTIVRQNDKLILYPESLPSLPISQYTYSLEFVTFDGTAENPQDFIVQENGTIVNYDAEPITEFTFDESADYSLIQINVNRVGSSTPRPRIILVGAMPSENGESVQLRFPVPLQQTEGQVFIKFDSKSGEYELEVNLEKLSDVREDGWKYAAWLVEESGPYVTNIIPAGTFNATSDSNKATHTYTTDRDLSGFNKLVISLEPSDDTDEEIFAIRPYSSELVLR